MNPKLSIIGIAGTNGSGKDSVGQILAKHYGYLFVSVTDILRAELKKRAQEITRENLRSLSAQWRRETGNLGVLVSKAVEEYKKMPGDYTGIAIASIRNPGEADMVHQLGGKMVWVDADPSVRYNRIQANAVARGRQGEDNLTFEEFLSDEDVEMNPPESADRTALDMAAVKERCDFFVANEVNNISALRDNVVLSLSL